MSRHDFSQPQCYIDKPLNKTFCFSELKNALTVGHKFSKITQKKISAKTILNQKLLVKFTINFEEMPGHALD